MLRYIVVIFIHLFCCYISNSQSVSQIKFKQLKWATSNKDSAFFYADTIRLLQVRAEKGPGMSFADYFKSDYIVLDFYKSKKYRRGSMIIDNWVQSSTRKDYNWSYNKRDNILTLQMNSGRVSRYVVAAVKKVYVKTVYIHDDIESIELLLVRQSF